MLKQVATNVKDHLLRRPHHHLRITRSRGHAHGIDNARGRNQANKPLIVALSYRTHNRLDHIGTRQVGPTRERDQHSHGKQLEPGVAHVGQKRPQRAAKVLRALGRATLTGHLAHPLRFTKFLVDRVCGEKFLVRSLSVHPAVL